MLLKVAVLTTCAYWHFPVLLVGLGSGAAFRNIITNAFKQSSFFDSTNALLTCGNNWRSIQISVHKDVDHQVLAYREPYTLGTSFGPPPATLALPFRTRGHWTKGLSLPYAPPSRPHSRCSGPGKGPELPSPSPRGRLGHRCAHP